MPLLALDTGEQGRQHSLDLHGGARAHDRFPLVLEQLRHILGWGKGAQTPVRPQGRGSASPQAPSAGSCSLSSDQRGRGIWALGSNWVGSGEWEQARLSLCPF